MIPVISYLDSISFFFIIQSHKMHAFSSVLLHLSWKLWRYTIWESQWPSGVSTGLPAPGPGIRFPKQSLEFFRIVNANLRVCVLNMIKYPQTVRGRGNSTVVSVCLSSRRSGFVPTSIRLSERWSLLLCYWLAPTSADDWFKKGRPCVMSV